jgi:hypothetical protein
MVRAVATLQHDQALGLFFIRTVRAVATLQHDQALGLFSIRTVRPVATQQHGLVQAAYQTIIDQA